MCVCVCVYMSRLSTEESLYIIIFLCIYLGYKVENQPTPWNIVFTESYTFPMKKELYSEQEPGTKQLSNVHRLKMPRSHTGGELKILQIACELCVCVLFERNSTKCEYFWCVCDRIRLKRVSVLSATSFKRTTFNYDFHSIIFKQKL